MSAWNIMLNHKKVSLKPSLVTTVAPKTGSEKKHGAYESRRPFLDVSAVVVGFQRPSQDTISALK